MKGKMRAIFKKAVLFLVTGGVSLFLAACYGMPYLVKQFCVRVIQPEGSPVPALKLSGSDLMDEYVTDMNGEAFVRIFDEGSPIIVDVKDVDGAANGVYPDQSHEVDPAQTTAIITLAP
jgi:hypothetical protein